MLLLVTLPLAHAVGALGGLVHQALRAVGAAA